jgi:hypothetical protein
MTAALAFGVAALALYALVMRRRVSLLNDRSNAIERVLGLLVSSNHATADALEALAVSQDVILCAVAKRDGQIH